MMIIEWSWKKSICSIIGEFLSWKEIAIHDGITFNIFLIGNQKYLVLKRFRMVDSTGLEEVFLQMAVLVFNILWATLLKLPPTPYSLIRCGFPFKKALRALRCYRRGTPLPLSVRHVSFSSWRMMGLNLQPSLFQSDAL